MQSVRWFLAGWIALSAPLALAAAPVILVLGDSLSAGYGIAADQSWVALLQQRLTSNGHQCKVVNASVSGETSSGGRSRLPALLQRHQPAVVVIELGGNDGLRGLPLTELRANLTAMVTATESIGAVPLIIGMRLPPNYGPHYTERFAAIYRDLSATADRPLVPFLLAEVATDPDLMQSDGIHPTAAAQPQLLDNVWPQLQPLLTSCNDGD